MNNSIGRNYVCVNCGAPVESLVKRYSSTVLKLVNCGNCENVADKYVEYDDVIMLIDVILFNKEAYRHLLYNTKFQNHWKLAILILIVKTSDEWLSIEAKESSDNYLIPSEVLILFITVLGEMIFFSIVCSYFIMFWKATLDKDYLKNISIIWKAIVSSSFGYLLLLPSLIWSDFQREVHLLFIYTYTLLSHIQALTVIFKIPKPLLAAVLISAIAANNGLGFILKLYFNLV